MERSDETVFGMFCGCLSSVTDRNQRLARGYRDSCTGNRVGHTAIAVCISDPVGMEDWLVLSQDPIHIQQKLGCSAQHCIDSCRQY
jgi:hypothetical protein